MQHKSPLLFERRGLGVVEIKRKGLKKDQAATDLRHRTAR